MDEQMNKEAIQEIIRKKFHGHDVLVSKYTPAFPVSIEREYARLCRAYMRLLKETMEEELPALKGQIMKERGTYRADGINDVLSLLVEVLDRIQKRFTEKERGFGLRRKLESFANLTRKLTIKEWKKAVSKTLGINILEDYYMGEFYRTAMEQWVDENVSLITSIPSETLGDMRKIIKDGFLNGKSTTRIMKDIQNCYDVKKSRASLIARDQVGKLNAAVTEAQQRDAGIEEYIWCDCGDGRVRDCHRALNGKKFRWDDPPEMWYVTKKGRKVMTGRHCHPGQDYQCRCRAKPVFKFGTFNAPIAGKEGSRSA